MSLTAALERTVRDPAAVVGPNAITQLVTPLRVRLGEDGTRRVFHAAGLERCLDEPPEAMVPQADAAALFAAVRNALPPADADAVLRAAGEGTADYVMANRIPAPVRALLRMLPATLAARLLLRAIARHAWTFAGSGRCTTRYGRPSTIAIETNPLATPGCPWHLAVFTRMFRTLVSPLANVRQVQCCGARAHACRWEIRLG